MAAQRFEQVQRVDEVVLIILGGVLDRFADEREGREVNDGLDPVRQQRMIEALLLRQVRDDEPIRRHRGAVALRQVVVDPNVVAALQKEPNRVTADVAGSAGDEDAHGFGRNP